MAIITTDNLKDWLRIESTDELDDTNLSVAVAAAQDAVVEYCGRSFDKVAEGAEVARSFSPRSRWAVDLDDVWSTTTFTVTSDDAGDGTFERTWAATDYVLTPLNGLRYGQAWPYTGLRAVDGVREFPYGYARPTVQVTAAWGWSSVPDPVFQATLLKAARLWRRKDSPDGLLGGYSDLGPLRVSSRDDPDVVLLLKPYVRASATNVLIA